jgi:hypothetical protein
MHGGATGTQHLLLAETLGLAMARRASDILERHRAALTSGSAAVGSAPVDDDDQFAVDNAIFTAVLDAANECLGQFDTRPADDRWCDALLQVIHLAQLARMSEDGSPGALLGDGQPAEPRPVIRRDRHGDDPRRPPGRQSRQRPGEPCPRRASLDRSVIRDLGPLGKPACAGLDGDT